jgi:hypothetical protein
MKLLGQFAPPLSRRLTVLLAVVLLAGLGFVQSVHLHDELAPSGAARSHCALCVFSHSPAVITAARCAPAPALDSVSPQSAEPQLRSRLLVSAITIRPPPSL